VDDIQLIRVALLNHADMCRRQATRRDMAGPRMASMRADKRAEAQQAQDLALTLVMHGQIILTSGGRTKP
jgi:hypothetical protein